MWHFLSFPHRMLYEKKKKRKEKKKGQRVGSKNLMKKSNDSNCGRGILEKSPCLSTDCIDMQWTVAELHQAALLGLRVPDCL